MEDLVINPRVTIPATQLDIQYARSSGPGGQNVNKLNTKATLKWQIRDNPILPQAWRDRVIHRYKNRLNNEGELVIHSERYRIQRRNAEDCLKKLQELLLSCQAAPKERIETKPTQGSRRRRLEQKNRLSEKKRLRRPPPGE